MRRPSTSRTGTTPANVPVQNASVALYTSVRLKVVSRAVIPASRQTRSALALVMPPRQNLPSEVHTSGPSSPGRTTKKWVELQLATKPCGSSISASSAPAVWAWMQALMSFSLLCALSFGSSVSGVARRTWVVNSVMPRSRVSGCGCLCSAIITTVAGPTVARGSWYGVALTPRVTISRTCTPSVIRLASSSR